MFNFNINVNFIETQNVLTEEAQEEEGEAEQRAGGVGFLVPLDEDED